MRKEIKGGIYNPLNLKGAHFDYEVIEQGDVENVEYEDRGVIDSSPQRYILIKKLGGDLSSEMFYCITCLYDALIELRKGEIISANLKFSVCKNQDGKYEQKVSAEDIYTLNDYYQIREAEALYQGSLMKDKKETA